MKKISILMPTYNGAETIKETIDSVIKQSYRNWELIIIDDGSKDNTEEIVVSYSDERIKYYFQENADQLNAILNGMNYLTGEYIYILHSDDLLPYSDFFDKCILEIENGDYDAIIGDLELIDANSNSIGKQEVFKYIENNKQLAKQLLWLGRNLFNDFPFIKKEKFETCMKSNYLINNMPFWYDVYEDFKMLKIKKVDFYMRKYRVFEGNYINNEIGKLNVINGELRTAIFLMNKFHIPFYNFQYIIYRTLNKLKLGEKFYPIYFNNETKRKDKIIKKILKTRYKKEYKKYKSLSAILKFYQKNIIREIDISDFEIIVYNGKDMRKFNNKLLKNNLPEIYNYILNEMEKGFSKVLIKKGTEKQVLEILKFLCISNEVEIIEK